MRLLLRFSMYCRPAVRLAGAGTLGVVKCFGIGIGAQIGDGQFVRAFPALFQVGGQFVNAEVRTFLNADVLVPKDRDVCSDRDLLCSASVTPHVEPIHAGVLFLIEAKVPDLHRFPFLAIEDRLNLRSMDLFLSQMPQPFPVFRRRI